jgi:ABC-2 type transport system ATP-binding protein
MMLGLAAPDSGTGTSTASYPDVPYPARTVGAALEADYFGPGRSARDQRPSAAPDLVRPVPVTGDPAGDFADASRPRARRPW